MAKTKHKLDESILATKLLKVIISSWTNEFINFFFKVANANDSEMFVVMVGQYCFA